MARVLVVDNQPIFRHGMARLLNSQSDVMCCGEAGSASEARKALATLKPDVMLLNLGSKLAKQIEIIESLKAQFPAVRILVISQFNEMTGGVSGTLPAGACGYIMKEQPPEEMMQAIRTVLAGDIYVKGLESRSRATLHSGQ